MMSTEDVDKLKAARADRRAVGCSVTGHPTAHGLRIQLAIGKGGTRGAALSSRDRQRSRRVVRPVDLVEACAGRVALGGQGR
jgi:hypothetical protein